MTLEQIRIFLAVAEQGHMTRAARSLNLTQSAVSASVAAFEAQHQIRLFDRIGRGIVLTDEGQAFVPTARALLAQAETARLVLDDLAREPRGRLRIHASQTVAGCWLPARLVALHARHPGIAVALSLGNTRQVAQAVADGDADLGLVEGEVAHGDLIRRVVARDELVLAAAAGNPVLTRPGFGAADYPGLTWVLREPGSGTRAAFEAHLAGLGLAVADLTVAFEIPSNDAVLAAVAAGDFVTVVSARAAALATGIGTRPVDWAPPPRRPFAALTHPDRHRSRALAALLAILDAPEAAPPG